MIARMCKVFVVARSAERRRLLEALRRLGVVHLAPVDPAKAAPDEKTVAALDRLRRAEQVLLAAAPAGQAPTISADEAAAEALRIQRESVERQSRLTALHHQLEQISLWGETRLEQFAELSQAGVEVNFYDVPADELDQIEAELVCVISRLSGKHRLVAVVDRLHVAKIPPGAKPIPLPARDRASIRAEAAEIDAALKRDEELLARLARLAPQVRGRIAELQQGAQWIIAMKGALADEELYAIQGWLPVDRTQELTQGLVATGLEVAVQTREPTDQEQPPTLIKYPSWVSPIQGLFKVLGIVPGYKEFDVSWAFMVALPIFAAMLIGDGGYGLLFLLVPLIFYRKLSQTIGPHLAQLLTVFGVTAIIWGLITTSFFGFDGAAMVSVGGVFEPLGRALEKLQLISVNLEDSSRNRLMRISFTIGAIHLSFAHLWRARAAFPHPRFLGNVGWAMLLWGMYGVVKMFVLDDPLNWVKPYPYLLITGGFLAIFFASPHRNILKAFLAGLAAFPLSLIGTFSDIMSYVRLMAICLAGSVLAAKFNEIALGAGWLMAIPILIFGHGLNIALVMIALFAHGVRLNILEFSNNLGMEWSGYLYEPFSEKPQEN